MTDIKPGDRVRVVLEGEVFWATSRTFDIGDANRRNVIYPDAPYVVSVEVIPPPIPAWEQRLLYALRDKYAFSDVTLTSLVADVRAALDPEPQAARDGKAVT